MTKRVGLPPILSVACAVVLSAQTAGPGPAPAADVGAGGTRFRVHTIGANVKGGYQVVASDFTRDGRKDLIDGVRNMSSMAACDIDRDGVPERALGYQFSGRPSGECDGCFACRA